MKMYAASSYDIRTTLWVGDGWHEGNLNNSTRFSKRAKCFKNNVSNKIRSQNLLMAAVS